MPVSGSITDELPVLEVGLHQRRGEQRHGDEQRDGHHDGLGVLGDVGGVDAERDEQQEARHQGDADRDRAGVEARRERDERDDQPGDRGAARAAGQRDAARDDELGEQPRRGDRELGLWRGGELPVDDREADDGDRQRHERPPPDPRTADEQRQGKGDERQLAKRPQPLFHVHRAHAIGRLRAEPGPGRRADVAMLLHTPRVRTDARRT
ncbi:MAG TPA: hypothetical protein VK501_02235 [Baekduia sp.]|uniref:hypothetical protein n=1 Tax=Baekduia sp. TaxID=2600305 RepID=UPI002C2AB851|nr:hypothetical protein [Baekduia sp.]HMJ32708.1 hypothetical protein [Baekduia sp.]